MNPVPQLHHLTLSAALFLSFGLYTADAEDELVETNGASVPASITEGSESSDDGARTDVGPPEENNDSSSKRTNKPDTQAKAVVVESDEIAENAGVNTPESTIATPNSSEAVDTPDGDGAAATADSPDADDSVKAAEAELPKDTPNQGLMDDPAEIQDSSDPSSNAADSESSEEVLRDDCDCPTVEKTDADPDASKKWAHRSGFTAEVKMSYLSWGTNGTELNRARLSGQFLRDIDVNSFGLETFLGYRFKHNRSISSSVGFLYGRGLTNTEIQQFGRVSRYQFRSWSGIGYKGSYHYNNKPDLDLVWYVSLIDFNLDSTEFTGSETEKVNAIFSGWGYGIGVTISQFIIGYNVYSVNLGSCADCSDVRVQSISLGWQYN